jgi:mannobiose 2-epimerase
MVGFINAFQETRRDEYLRAALGTWEFIERWLVDRENGEWRRRTTRDGTPLPDMEKVGPWKSPYHNGRACLEIIRRARKISATATPRKQG